MDSVPIEGRMGAGGPAAAPAAVPPGVLPLRLGRLRVRLGEGPADIARARALRSRCFRPSRPGPGPLRPAADADRFDALCAHLLVEDADSAALLACVRLIPFSSGAAIHIGYAAQFYDLQGLSRIPQAMLEVGRLCVRPGGGHADALRAIWIALTRIVDALEIGMMFGCVSFPGADPARHAEALGHLHRDHLAPERWRPGVRAARAVPLAGVVPPAGESSSHPLGRPSSHPSSPCSAAAPGAAGDARRVARALPPLLRGYLAMGGRVSDHAVIDPELDTLHVFIGVEVEAIPATRRRLLRAAAAACGGGR